MYSLCEQQFFMHYILGWPMKAGKAAEKGTIVHKVLEILANLRKAEQDGVIITEDEHIGDIDCGHHFTDNRCVDWLINRCFECYTEMSENGWEEKDYNTCYKWVWDALTFGDGQFDPRHKDIVEPEMQFDIPIEEDWAYYNYRLPSGERLKGQLAIKGTIDLVTSPREKVWEATDYKTGRMLDWATGEEKAFVPLCSDPQLRM
jgi:hypothetical protein